MFRAVAFFVDSQRSAHERLGLPQSVRVLEQTGQVVEADGDSGVLRAVAFFVHGQRPSHERFGLLWPVGGLEQTGQVAEVNRDCAVFHAVALFVDSQRPAHKAFCVRPAGEMMAALSYLVGEPSGFRMFLLVPQLCQCGER